MFGLSETFLVSVRLGLIGFWPKRDFLLLLGGLIGGSAKEFVLLGLLQHCRCKSLSCDLAAELSPWLKP